MRSSRQAADAKGDPQHTRERPARATWSNNRQFDARTSTQTVAPRARWEAMRSPDPPRRAAMTPPLVSVIMPAFNAERWIGESIESVLGQSWRHLELIIVDDGS